MKENNNNTIYKYSQLYDILLEKITRKRMEG